MMRFCNESTLMLSDKLYQKIKEKGGEIVAEEYSVACENGTQHEYSAELLGVERLHESEFRYVDEHLKMLVNNHKRQREFEKAFADMETFRQSCPK